LDLSILADQNKYKLLMIFTIKSVTTQKRMIFLRVVKRKWQKQWHLIMFLRVLFV